MADRCRWFTDPEIGRYDVPGCWGAAVYGPRGCTCPPRGGRRPAEERTLEDRLASLETLVAKLAASLPPAVTTDSRPIVDII